MARATSPASSTLDSGTPFMLTPVARVVDVNFGPVVDKTVTSLLAELLCGHVVG